MVNIDVIIYGLDIHIASLEYACVVKGQEFKNEKL